MRRLPVQRVSWLRLTHPPPSRRPRDIPAAAAAAATASFATAALAAAALAAAALATAALAASALTTPTRYSLCG